jgi:sulfite reductase (NADPH) hemoprotein beta-component
LFKLYAEDLDHAGIIAHLNTILAAYARERHDGERFGDYIIRAGFIAATENGRISTRMQGARDPCDMGTPAHRSDSS